MPNPIDHVTKVTDSVMDLGNVRQDIVLGTNTVTSAQSKITGVVAAPTLDDEASSKKYVDDQILVLLALIAPPGLGPLPWSGVSAPAGWLLCDGASYPTATYPGLFAEIGYTHGGSGPNFNVPDMGGRFTLGLNTLGSGVNRVNRVQSQNLGQISGDENVILSTPELPAHNHTAIISPSGGHIHTGGTTNNTGSHTHPFTPAGTRVWRPGGGSGTDSGVESVVSFAILAAGDHTHTVTVPSDDSDHTHTVSIGFTPAASAHENTPPFLTVNYIIKT